MKRSVFSVALEESKALFERMPRLFVLSSVIRQLEYLVRLEDGLETDRDPVRTMNFGLIAVRDLWQTDENLADLLSRAAVEAERRFCPPSTPHNPDPTAPDSGEGPDKDD